MDGANMDGANLDGANLDEIQSNETTVLPDSFLLLWFFVNNRSIVIGVFDFNQVLSINFG